MSTFCRLSSTAPQGQLLSTFPDFCRVDSGFAGEASTSTRLRLFSKAILSTFCRLLSGLVRAGSRLLDSDSTSTRQWRPQHKGARSTKAPTAQRRPQHKGAHSTKAPTAQRRPQHKGTHSTKAPTAQRRPQIGGPSVGPQIAFAKFVISKNLVNLGGFLKVD